MVEMIHTPKGRRTKFDRPPFHQPRFSNTVYSSREVEYLRVHYVLFVNADAAATAEQWSSNPKPLASQEEGYL